VQFLPLIEQSLTLSFVAAAQSETLDSLFRTLNRVEPVGRDAPSHKLLHHLVEVTGSRAYKDYTMVFASKWVAEMVMRRRMLDERDNLIAVASGARDLGNQLRGRAYETVCRGQLQELRSLDLLELPSRQIHRINSSSYDTISQPINSNEVVDMVAVRKSGVTGRPTLLLFNFTVDLQHGIKSKRLNALVRELLEHHVDRAAAGWGAIGAQVVYVWVVPSGIEPSFALQRKSRATGPEIDKRVRQMLIVLDPQAT